jgi:hypothetical protein
MNQKKGPHRIFSTSAGLLILFVVLVWLLYAPEYRLGNILVFVNDLPGLAAINGFNLIKARFEHDIKSAARPDLCSSEDVISPRD